MATKPGVLSRVASKTVAAGRRHAAKVLEGEETLAEAAGATVKDLLSPAKEKSARKSSLNKLPAKSKITARKRSTSKRGLSTKKGKTSSKSKLP